MNTSEQIQWLKDYGADTASALERFVDDEVLYVECIGMFLDDDGFRLLGDALQKQDAKAAFEAAHGMKGVAANLGLAPLLADICSIVEPLRGGRNTGLDEAYAAILASRDKLKALFA